MTVEQVALMAKAAGMQWAPFADPLRPFGNEEPWLPADPEPQLGVPLLDVDDPGRWWLVALAVVLLLLAWRKR